MIKLPIPRTTRLVVLAVTLALVAGAAFVVTMPRQEFPLAARLVFLVAAWLGCYFAWSAAGGADTPAAAPPSEPRTFFPKQRLAGLLLIVLGALLGAWGVYTIWQVDNAPAGVWAWFGCMALLIAGGFLIGRLGRAEAAPANSAGPAFPLRLEIACVVLLLALGLFLRLFHLGNVPPGIFVDETNAAGDALRILDGWKASAFGVGWYETPLGYIYYMAGVLKLLGTTYFALKIASLIPAFLTLIALYFLGRELFGPPPALLSLAFMAMSRWHLILSRWGWNELAPPLFHVLTMLFLLRGVRRRRALDFVLAGISLGLCMYTYLASRLVVAAIVLYLLYRIVIERGFLRRAGVGLVLFAISYALIFAPLASTYVKNPVTFSNRSSQVTILNDMHSQYAPENAAPGWVRSLAGALGQPTEITLKPLGDNILKHLSMFHGQGDGNPRHNLPNAPMLDPLTGIFFLLGALYSPLRLRDTRRGLLLSWIAVVLLGGILSAWNEGPQAYRTLGVLPAVCLLAGDALWLTFCTVRQVLPARRLLAFATPAALGLVLLAAVGLNADLVFRQWAESPRVWIAFSPLETAAGRRVAATLDSAELYLSPTLFWGSPVRFLTYRSISSGGGGLNMPPYQSVQPAEDLPLATSADRDAIFLLEDSLQELSEIFHYYYPHAEESAPSGPQGEPLYVEVRVPAADKQALWGLKGSYRTEDGNSQTRVDAPIDFTWPKDLPAEKIADVQWAGSLLIDRSNTYDLAGEGALYVTLDGQVWEKPHFLAKGLHSLTLTQSQPGTVGQEQARLLWRYGAALSDVQVEGQSQEPPSEWAVVPAEHLVQVGAPAQGLIGRYFAGPEWKGKPFFTRRDPTIAFGWSDEEPIRGEFSVTWTGYLVAPIAGLYQFDLGSDDGSRLWLDDQLLGESTGAGSINVEIELAAGRHPLQVDYYQTGGAKGIVLRWRLPGEDHTVVVPPSALQPG